MDQSSLQRLADDGLAAFPPDRLPEAAGWCWEFGAATGDARWCLLARTLDRLAAPFTDGNGALPSELTSQIDSVLRDLLPDVLYAPTAVEGASLAQLLDDRLPWVAQR